MSSVLLGPKHSEGHPEQPLSYSIEKIYDLWQRIVFNPALNRGLAGFNLLLIGAFLSPVNDLSREERVLAITIGAICELFFLEKAKTSNIEFVSVSLDLGEIPERRAETLLGSQNTLHYNRAIVNTPIPVDESEWQETL